MAEYRIVVQIDPTRAKSGRRAVEGELSAIDRAAARTQMAVNRALAFAGVSVGLAGLVAMADQYTELQNRLRTVTSTTEQLSRATEDLYGVARKTRVAFAETVELYTRTAQASKNLGLSYKELLQFTTSVNQAVILSGATASEAAGGLRQLSQGLATGTLRGDELVSVLENLPVVADVIAKELGVTRGELRKLGQDGKISAQDIVEAFRNAREELDERFGRTVPTIAQGLVAVRDAAMKLWGEFTTGTGVSSLLAGTLMWLADNLELVTKGVILLATVLATRYVATVLAGAISATVAYIGQLIALEMALGATSVAAAIASAAMKQLQFWLLANPFTAIVAVITTIVAALVLFGDQISVGTGRLANFHDLVVAFFQVTLENAKAALQAINEFIQPIIRQIQAVLAPVLSVLEEAWGRFKDVIKAVFGDIEFSLAGFLRVYAGIMDTFVGVLISAYNITISLWQGLGPALGDLAIQAVNNVIRAWNQLPQTVAELINTVLNFFIGGYEGILAGAKALPAALENYFRTAWKRAVDASREALSAIIKSIATMSTDALDAYRGASDVGEGVGEAVRAGVEKGLQGGPLIDASTFKLTELDNPFKGAANRLGQNIAQDIAEGMSFRGYRDTIENILNRAEELARKRQGAANDNDFGGGTASAAASANDNDKKGSKKRSFQDYLDDLEEEAELLKLSGVERAIRAEQLRIEDGLDRQLTASENEMVAALVRQNEALAVQSDLYEELQGPVQAHLDRMAALKALLDAGKISQEAFNAAQLADPLVRDIRDVDASLEGTALQQQAERDQLLDDQAQKLLIIQQGLEARILTEQEAAERRVAIEADTQRRLRDLEAARMSAALGAAQSTADSLADIAKNSLGEQSAVYKAMFAASKAFAIADAIVKIQQGIANALSLPFPANLAAISSVAAAAASIVSNIQAVSLALAGGGAVSGPGTGTSDSIPARLSDGEYVVRAAAAKKNMPLLEAINSGRTIRESTAANSNVAAGGGRTQLNVSVKNYAAGVEHEVRQISEDEVEVIAKRVVQRDAGKAVAGDLSNPNSTVSKSLARNTKAERRHA